MSDPFHDRTRCPWCTGASRYPQAGEYEGRKTVRYCADCNLLFTSDAPREWDDALFNPHLRKPATKAAGASAA